MTGFVSWGSHIQTMASVYSDLEVIVDGPFLFVRRLGQGGEHAVHLFEMPRQRGSFGSEEPDASSAAVTKTQRARPYQPMQQ